MVSLGGFLLLWNFVQVAPLLDVLCLCISAILSQGKHYSFLHEIVSSDVEWLLGFS